MTTGEEQLRDWMVSGLGGDAAAQTQLLRALVPLLRRFYRRRLADADAIEDLVQETLIAVHTRRLTYDPGRAFTAWLYAIARYKMIDHFRRQGKLCPIDGLEDSLVAEGFADAADAQMDVERLLDTLPSKQARAIRATRIEGLSIVETAKREKMGESDVKVSVHRGIKALSRLIGSDLG